MKFKITLLFTVTVLLFTACDDDNTASPSVTAPATYSFERDGQTTVSFSGQTTRIQMGEELINTLLDFDANETKLLEMYANETVSGQNANPFADTNLNESTKSVRSKTAASIDYFSANTVDASQIKAQFADWISLQVNEVFPNENELAEAGKAGQIADGSATRYVNAQGVEYNQLVNKGLIGALMLDQALNNYLSPAVLDAADNRDKNEAKIVEEGTNYTSMEHKWDEAYGYFYGTATNPADPNATIGSDDSFMNKYIGRVEGDADFTGIAANIYDAFKLGRAAIVAGDYDLRDEQAAIIQEKASEIIGIRAVYYLQQAKIAMANGEMGTAFHDLSEGLGFIYSLQFTRKPKTTIPYFTKTEVEGFWSQLLDNGDGLWDVTPTTLDAISNSIADEFDFTIGMAGS